MNNSPKILTLKIPMGELSYTLTSNDRNATTSAAAVYQLFPKVTIYTND